MKLFLILTLCVYSVYADISSDLEPLTDEIVDAINALKTSWKADKNFNGSSSVQIDKLVSTQMNISDHFPMKEYPMFDIPTNFDAREAWPNCTSIGKIYDQIKGYPSWVYTAVGSIADRLCIKHGVEIDVEATVDEIVRSSGCNNEYNSAHIGQAFDYWSKYGVYTVESAKQSSCLPVSQSCAQKEIKLNRYFNVSNDYVRYASDIKRDLILNGPLPAYMEIRSDFPSYKSGVYKRTSQKVLGIQNMKIIGYGTYNSVDYWLAAGSWGTEWADKGFFKFRIGGEMGDVPFPITFSLEPVDISEQVSKSFNQQQLLYLV